MDASKEDCQTKVSHEDTNFEVTDGRVIDEWKTRYESEAVKQIVLEGIYIFAMLLISVFSILYIIDVITSPSFDGNKNVYYLLLSMAGGLLGGITFGIKFFYHALAKGYWNQDRLAWRLLSPFLAIVLAMIICLMVDSGLIQNVESDNTWKGKVIVAFMSGYFADDASRKLKDVASVVFGKSKDSD